MIAVKQLRYSYPGASRRGETATPTLKGLDFDVSPGEIFGFLGPSGSGKSTTQKLLTGSLSGYQGSISLRGRELSEWDNSYYREIGVGFELPNHFSRLTALENLALFASFYEQDTLEPGSAERTLPLNISQSTTSGPTSVRARKEATEIRPCPKRDRLRQRGARATVSRR